MNFDVSSFEIIFDYFDKISLGISNVAYMCLSIISSMPPIISVGFIFTIVGLCICIIIRAITI